MSRGSIWITEKKIVKSQEPRRCVKPILVGSYPLMLIMEVLAQAQSQLHLLYPYVCMTIILTPNLISFTTLVVMNLLLT
ncbi:hypothetical protein C2G38_2062409 [Gigaspora rosea]|uniref:Uncharacterized protein n=1 Tax=Gigaspora rosea TaxID=44941 RepID=A0A397VZB8_9GLOM|nr:hypothetical protein C2G38_2062409 [Gigaspora rosea]